MPERQFVAPFGDHATPASWTLPAALEVIPRLAYAKFDGSGAAGAFQPCLRFISDSGHVASEATADSIVAAGGSADVSWFPHLARERFRLVVATSVAGLGAPYDGKAGAFLSDTGFVTPLVYSASVGRWLSPYSQGPTIAVTGDTTTAGAFTVLAGAATQRASVGTYANYYNAGLRMSVDFAALIQNTGANTTSLRLELRSLNGGDTTSSLDAYSSTITNTGVTNTWEVQEWSDLTIVGAPTKTGYSFLAAAAQVTAGTGQIASLVSRYRWYGVA